MSAELDQVLKYLELEQVGDDEFQAHSLPQIHGRVYGGQVLAQAVIAAAATTADTRDIHSLHGYFLRAGQLDEPITIKIDRMRDGRSFSARRANAYQQGKIILTMLSSFQEDQPGITHQVPPPDVPGPEKLASSTELFSAIKAPNAAYFYRASAFDIRHVDGALFTKPATEPAPRQQLWMRARGAIPADQALHRAVLTFACDQIMLEPIMRAHGLHWQAKGASVASLDHSMWFHHDVDVTQWLLYDQLSPSAQGSRGLGQANVYNSKGQLVASMAQEGMMRFSQPLD